MKWFISQPHLRNDGDQLRGQLRILQTVALGPKVFPGNLRSAAKVVRPAGLRFTGLTAIYNLCVTKLPAIRTKNSFEKNRTSAIKVHH